MKRNYKIFLALSTYLTSILTCYSYGTGQISYPLRENQKLLTTELTGITTDDGGVGLQLRYDQKLGDKFIVEGGVGLASGDRSSRFFVASDYEILPDYSNQPRLSLKTGIERAEELDATKNIISLAPVVSKGFSFWGHVAYPFLSTPLSLNLKPENSTYETTISANLGLTSAIPYEGFERVKASFEAQINLKDSFTGILLGVSYLL